MRYNLTLLVFCLCFLAIFFFSSFLASGEPAPSIELKYSVGEIFKANLEDLEPSAIRFTTPSKYFVYTSNNSRFSYLLDEEGEYVLEIKGNREKIYRLSVAARQISGENSSRESFVYYDVDSLDQLSYESLSGTPKELVTQTRSKESSIVVGKPVAWNKRVRVSGDSASLVIPLVASDIRVSGDSDFKTTTSVKNRIGNYFRVVDEQSLLISSKEVAVEVSYVTPAPRAHEEIISDTEKIVHVSSKLHYEDVEVSSLLPHPIRDYGSASLYWVEEDRFVSFRLTDTNEDGVFEEMVWIADHLSNQTFRIIVIVDALHLSSNKSFISNIYPEVKHLDSVWSEPILHKEYVRVTFEENLTSQNDITLFPRILLGRPFIEVYAVGDSSLLANFSSLTSERYHKLYLTSLVGFQDTFDLRVFNGEISFDHIIDPTAEPGATPDLRAQLVREQNSQQVQNVFPDLPLGTYPSGTCATNGDRLSCDDGITETATSIKTGGGGGFSGYGGVNISSYNTGVTDCGSIDEVFLCYEFWGSNKQHSCTIGVDANGGSSWSDTSVTCSASAPGVTCTNVTSQENWTCGNFFDSSGTRSLAKAQAQKTGGSGPQTWDFDVLFFNVSYSVDLSAIILSLNAPDDKGYSSTYPVSFNYSATKLAGSFVNCSLYDNSTGTFSYNQTNASSILNGSFNTITKTYPSDGYFLWNIECCDSSSCTLSPENRTLTVDTVPPVWWNATTNVSSGNPGDGVRFSTNWNDSVGLDSWTFFWDLGGGFVPAGSGSFSNATEGNSSIIKTLPGSMEGQDIFWYFRAFDLAGGQNQSSGNDFVSVNDVTAPVINSEGVNQSSVSYGEPILISANVTDNIQVDSVWAEISRPGAGDENVSFSNVTLDDWEVQYSSTLLGTHNATVYANDTSGLIDSGTLLSWNVTGLSDVFIEYPLFGSFGSGSLLTIRCRVNDSDTGSDISGYNVSFYAAESFLGSDLTNASGVATYDWTVSGAGSVTLNCTITDDASLFYVANQAMDSSSITVLSPNISVILFEHENNVSFGLEEYDLGDTISYSNVTVNNTGQADASSVNVSLNLLYPNGSIVSWFDETTESCGGVPSFSSCEVSFDNESFGYVLEGVTSGLYSFNATAEWVSVNNETSSGQSPITLHYIPENISSAIYDPEISAGVNTTYAFNITNPWSENITNVTLSIECPAILGLNCIWAGSGNENVTLLSLANQTFSSDFFNISTNASTPVGEYLINLSLSYTNPGSEVRSFIRFTGDTLSIRPLLAVIEAYPLVVNRTGNYFLAGDARNIGSENLTDVSFSWTLPSSWVNSSGALFNSTSLLEPDESFWGNITALVELGSVLGPQTIFFEANSPDASLTVDSVSIDVYAQTFLSPFTSNETTALRGQSIQMSARLILDNGTVLVGENVSFQSLTNVTTNGTGWAVFDYVIPLDARLGANNFSLNSSFVGNASRYILSSFNTTNITVEDQVIIDSSHTPGLEGFGRNISIEANVTTGGTIDSVYANVSSPLGDLYFTPLSFISGDTYRLNFTNTWQRGDYSYTIFANNTEGFENETTTPGSYLIEANVTLSVDTLDNFYIANELVNLTNPSDIIDVPSQSLFDLPFAQAVNRQDQEPIQNNFSLNPQGTYPAACGSSADRLSCDEGITETASSFRSGGTGYYGGLNISSYNTSITNCDSIDQVILTYEFWGASSQHACTIGVDGNGGSSWSDTGVTCFATEPGIATLNVTGSEAWNCSHFFGSAAGPRALAKAQAQRTGGGGTQLWEFDVLYFNVSYSTAAIIDGRNASLLNNTGTTSLNAYYLMTVEYNNSGVWEYSDTVLNDSATSTLRTISFLDLLNLSDYWNDEAGAWNTLQGGGGDYRAVVTLTDGSGIPLTDSFGSNISSNGEFEIDAIPPSINLTFPENVSTVFGLAATLNYTATDPSGVDQCSLFHNKTGSFSLEQTKPHIADVENSFIISGFTENTYLEWNVRCNDSAGNEGFNASSQFFTQIVPPDFYVNSTSVTWDNASGVIENVNVTLQATVWNIGGQDGDTNVSFFYGDPTSGGVLIANDSISVTVGSMSVAQVNWSAQIGPANIFVHVDPPIATNGSVVEINESNNVANNTFSVPSWQELFGNASIEVLLASSGLVNISGWANDTTGDGNIFVVDSEASIEWLLVYALGRDDGDIPSSSDFSELDTVLGMENYTDSVSDRFTLSQIPITTENITVQGREVFFVPIVNSSAGSNFITGILWDSSDDTNGEYDSGEQEDVIFVSRIDLGQTGGYGTYDYEVTYPVSLRSYDAAEETTVNLYFSLN